MPVTGPGAYQNDFKTTGFFSLLTTPIDNSGMDAAKFVHKLQRTWFSNNVKDAFTGNVPVGTVAIKETYDPQMAASARYVMVKRSTDTWFYEVRKLDGTVDTAGPSGENVAMCHGCHTAFKTTDYLGGTTYKN
ncbi:MAG: hypothetical protein JNK82_16110 [Myxococcaceae bacterium]|nr:hypothetical protein [Myxococcaceae bacterium]